MTNEVILYGYKFSVYNWIARVVLHEKGVDHSIVEVNPFSGDVPAKYHRLHPFGRVPVLFHGTFTVFETSAIGRYVDAGFKGPSLTPVAPRSIARMAQVIAIIDNYGYWPMIRQVFAHRVFRPLSGEKTDEAEVVVGLTGTHEVLTSLEAIVSEGEILEGRQVTLADCHLAPMISYLLAAREGEDAFAAYPALSAWWSVASSRASIVETYPGLPKDAE